MKAEHSVPLSLFNNQSRFNVTRANKLPDLKNPVTLYLINNSIKGDRFSFCGKNFVLFKAMVNFADYSTMAI